MIKNSLSFLKILCLLLVTMSSLIYAQKGLFIGTIQFPALDTIPSIRVYYAGKIISCEIHEKEKKVVFSIPEMKERAFFYVLITPEIEFFSHENTVPCLKLKENCAHKFYVLQRVAVQPKTTKKRSVSQPEWTWVVTELNLRLPDNRIPDDCIIVQYYPEFIQNLEGGNAIEFPKIMIKNDILAMVGSEQKLLDLSNRLFLAALNTDTIHHAIPSEFVMGASKTILAVTA